MGYQLWTSPVTGYRRKGTRLKDFNEAFGEKITVAAIFEPLRSCPSDAPSHEMQALLEELDFDVAGVRAAFGAPVCGFVRREDLTSDTVGAKVRSIPPDAVVDVSTSMHTLFASLEKYGFVFVRVEEDINGIVTYADLNKPIVRVYFFGMISLLEIHLSYWIAEKYTDASWQGLLSKKRIDAAEEVRQERESGGQSLDLRDCLQFSDKRTLVVQHDALRADLNLGSKGGATRLLRRAEMLRNALAHSQYDLTIGYEWPDLVALVQQLESIVALSDALVEERAGQSIKLDLTTLW